MRALCLLLWLQAPPLAAAPPRKPRLAAGLVIASVRIETHNVFDTSAPPENKAFYKAANAVHFQTRDHVVAAELLFEAGDRYDPLLIEETERNLRRLSFVRRAEVSAVVNAKGAVDVVVRTYDSWTLELVASFKRAGKSTSVKAGIADHNILGLGKSGSAVYSDDGGAASRALSYKDRHFLRRRRLQYSMLAHSALGQRLVKVSLERPFYASIAPNAVGGSVSYAENALDGGLRSVGEASASYGVALATSTERTRRVTFGVLARRAKTAGAAQPDLEQLTFFKLGADWQELDFVTLRRIQNFTRDEDYRLGLGVFPSVAWAPRLSALGTTESQIVPRLDLSKGFAGAGHLVLLKSGYGSTYVNGGNGNRVVSLDATYFVRGLPRQTLALHTGAELGWQLDAASELTLGELNGLRGYGLSEFTGSRRFLFNLEDRVYLKDDLLRVLDVGAVVFADSGYVWPSSSAVKLGDLKSSVGVGLRLAPSRSASNSPVRVDLAFPLSRRPGRAGWSLSILAGQAF